MSAAGEQQQPLKNGELNYLQISKNNRFIKQYLEDEIALGKNIFWAKKKRIYKEANNKAINIAKKKSKSLTAKIQDWIKSKFV